MRKGLQESPWDKTETITLGNREGRYASCPTARCTRAVALRIPGLGWKWGHLEGSMGDWEMLCCCGPGSLEQGSMLDRLLELTGITNTDHTMEGRSLA